MHETEVGLVSPVEPEELQVVEFKLKLAPLSSTNTQKTELEQDIEVGELEGSTDTPEDHDDPDHL